MASRRLKPGCSLRVSNGNPIEENAYRIAGIYHGRHFNTDPSAVLRDGTCVNADY